MSPRGQKNAAKTHCKHGHPYTPENISVNVNGARICKTCVHGPHRDVVRIEWPTYRAEQISLGRLGPSLPH